MHGKVDVEIENEGGGFNLPMIQNSKSIPNGVTTKIGMVERFVDEWPLRYYDGGS